MLDRTPPPLDALFSSLALSRRAFLGTVAGGAVLALTGGRTLHAAGLDARPRVVAVHHAGAVTWDFQTGWYGDRVDQPLVDTMLDRALVELTGLGNVGAAWRSLLAGYTPGKKIAVKVNFNNCWSCADADNIIDALVEIVNAVVRGMTTAGVLDSDVWIYDSVRYVPDRFVKRLRQPGVVCWSKTGTCNTRKALFTATRPGSRVAFSRPIPDQLVTDVLADADYLVNLPITKRHSLAGLTLGYKNHFGTIHNCGDLHDYIRLDSSVFSTQYNPMVEYMGTVHFRKTVLTIADCLYGCLPHQSGTPQPWRTFSNRSPATLLVATDPVAIDCVQRDLLVYEAPSATDAKAEAYLQLAAQAGQGVYEATPAQFNYQLIDYRPLELAGAGWFRPYGTGKPGANQKTPTWRHTGVPAPGATVLLEILDGRPGSTALVLVGHKEAAIPHPLGQLLVTPLVLFFEVPLDAAGAARIPIALPTGAGAVGTEFTAQAAIVDPGVAGGLSHTGGLRMHIGTRV
ncbi:MAG: DUF362 domain-containing protein [Planctomycetes bacterium]|nr:DUF362 domain-containing protein [Planctomycetota bacterium]